VTETGPLFSTTMALPDESFAAKSFSFSPSMVAASSVSGCDLSIRLAIAPSGSTTTLTRAFSRVVLPLLTLAAALVGAASEPLRI
jgi:hypothetical protein